MGNTPFYLVVTVFYIIVFGTPLLISFLLFKLIKKNISNPKWRLLSLIPILIFGYWIIFFQ